MPPYALARPAFRFPALAVLAERLPVGAGRETALATLLAARTADGACPPALTSSARIARASAAQHWLGATCPDAKVRAACLNLVATTVGDDHATIARALSRVIDVTGNILNSAARAELEALVVLLRD